MVDSHYQMLQGLLAHKKEGSWRNTQENCFVLLALDLYFRVKEGTVPDFKVDTWLGTWVGLRG